ncbi:MAG: bifunctional serine/threonine-protein kinase/formylglycine-generating enzyme family protein, partial [Planctomycetota bacterium]|nr:bifunctional serine/threonine-protein kinase/formylglycine-generating enzyme family protein [Planctomycetota bacterium]
MKVGAFGRGPGKWRLDESTRRFLEELEAGKRPRIEDHLDRAEPHTRATLLRELLATEARFRIKVGEAVKSDDYARRFPELTGEEIEKIVTTGDGGTDSAESESMAPGTLQPGAASDSGLPAFHDSWEDSHGVGTSRSVETSLSRDDEESQGSGSSSRQGSGGAASSSFPPLPPLPPPPLPAPAPVPEPPRPVEIGRYQLIRTLGSGTYGEVLEAADPELDRHVALKLPRSGRKLSADAVARFRAEGRVLARLRHPGLVAVYDAGVTSDGRPFVVSELVDGEDLSARLTREGKLSVEEATRIVAEAAEALATAHAAGIVHRDVKPANLMINRDGDVRVADFCIALQDEQQEAAKGEVLGSPAYMAPEQFTGEAHLLDGRADVWALGVVLYELLTGRRPFPAQSFEGLKEEVLKRDPRPLRQLNPKLPAWIDAVLAKCLAKKPSDRYGTAADLALDLRRGQVGFGARRRGRRAWLAFAMVLLVATAAGLTAISRLTDLRWPWDVKGSTVADSKDANAASVDRDRVEADTIAPVEPPVPAKRQWLVEGMTAAPGAELLELSPGADRVAWSRILRTVERADGSKIDVPFLLIPSERFSDPPAFYIMETKVWNDLFHAFADAHPEVVAGSLWTKGAEASGRSLGVEGQAAMFPVLNVRLREAVPFATWLGGRLPTTKEWDKAAGLDDRPKEATGPFEVLEDISKLDVAVGREATGPIPIGSSKHDVSTFGMKDVAGNGWELTSTSFFGGDLASQDQWEDVDGPQV